MAKINVILTDEHIALIRSFYFQKLKSRELILPDSDSVTEEIDKEFSNSDAVHKEEILTFCMKMLKQLKVQKMDDYYGIDTYGCLYGGNHLAEDMARILGYYDKVIPETMESPMGPRFPEEIENHLIELDEYIVSNLTNIEEILHQHCSEGIKAGKYTSLDRTHIWKYVGE